MQIRLPRSLPDELLYGRAGYLWACLFLNKHIGEGTIPASVTVILGLFQFTILVLTFYFVVCGIKSYCLCIFVNISCRDLL